MRAFKVGLLLVLSNCIAGIMSAATGFEGRIRAELTNAGETHGVLYIVGTSALRTEVTGADFRVEALKSLSP
jgi:hypothetical protein